MLLLLFKLITSSLINKNMFNFRSREHLIFRHCCRYSIWQFLPSNYWNSNRAISNSPILLWYRYRCNQIQLWSFRSLLLLCPIRHWRSEFTIVSFWRVEEGGVGECVRHLNVHISKENIDIYTALALKCNKHNLM